MRCLPLLALPSLLCVACPAPSEICGLPTTLPGDDDVANGRGTATRSDGAAFDEAGSWSTVSLDIVVGTLTMTASADETGSRVADLIEAAAFPICVPIGERSETSGSANHVGDNLISDATHTGGVAILAEEGGLLIGRFSVDLEAPSTGEERSITDGVFRVGRR
jgi:hypothetical protein